MVPSSFTNPVGAVTEVRPCVIPEMNLRSGMEMFF